MRPAKWPISCSTVVSKSMPVAAGVPGRAQPLAYSASPAAEASVNQPRPAALALTSMRLSATYDMASMSPGKPLFTSYRTVAICWMRLGCAPALASGVRAAETTVCSAALLSPACPLPAKSACSGWPGNCQVPANASYIGPPYWNGAMSGAPEVLLNLMYHVPEFGSKTATVVLPLALHWPGTGIQLTPPYWNWPASGAAAL